MNPNVPGGIEQIKQQLMRQIDAGWAQWVGEMVARTSNTPEYPRLGSVAPAQEEENRPKCKRHRRFMKYNPAEDRMECTEEGCTQRASKVRSFKNALGADLEGRPVVYRGGLEFVTDADGELYLYLVDSNALVSVHGIDQAKPFTDDAAASSKSVTFIGTVAKFLRPATVAAEALARRNQASEDMDRMQERMAQRLRRKSGRPGGQKLFGIPLPPHVRSVDNVNQLREIVTGLGVSKQISESIALGLAKVYQEIDDDGDLHLRFYTASGDLVRPVVLMYRNEWRGRPIAVLETLKTELNSLDTAAPDQAPHYGMFGGKMWNIGQVRQALLEAERTD